jgi:hypothetical protein
MSNPTWRKSSRSTAQGGDCVEVARLGDAAVGIRDSKNPGLGHLTVTDGSFAALVADAKRGRFDH